MTTTVYLDESGDLGFDWTKPRTSRFFVVAAMLCSDTKAVDKAVKRVFSGFSKTQIKARHGVFHAYREDRRTREKLLCLLAKADVSVAVVRLDKRRVVTAADDRHKLYNQAVNALLDRIFSRGVVPGGTLIQLIASQRETNGFLNETFAASVSDSVRSRLGVRPEVQIAPTSAHKGLQAVDCVSYGFFVKYEHGDPSYADLVADKLVEDSSVSV